MSCRILLADPIPLIQTGIADLLGDEQELEVCATAGSAPEARRALREEAPDLVILSLSLRETDGLGFLEDLRASHPDLPVIVFGRYQQATIAEHALAVGANGYVSKSAPTETVIEAIRRVLGGETYVSPDVAG